MCSAETAVVICLFCLVNPKTYLLAELTAESHLHVSTWSQTAQAAVKLCTSSKRKCDDSEVAGNGIMMSLTGIAQHLRAVSDCHTRSEPLSFACGADTRASLHWDQQRYSDSLHFSLTATSGDCRVC